MDLTKLDLERLGIWVAARTGISTPAALSRAIEATLEVVDTYRGSDSFDRASFVSEVAAREGVAEGFAFEHSEVVLQAVGELLLPDERARLVSQLPEAMAPLFEPAVRAPASRHPAGSGRTLADGRPGSRHPVSDFGVDRAHGDSIARAGSPRGDRKLATSRGVENEDKLAIGRPGSATPLSDSKD